MGVDQRISGGDLRGEGWCKISIKTRTFQDMGSDENSGAVCLSYLYEMPAGKPAWNSLIRHLYVLLQVFEEILLVRKREGWKERNPLNFWLRCSQLQRGRQSVP